MIRDITYLLPFCFYYPAQVPWDGFPVSDNFTEKLNFVTFSFKRRSTNLIFFPIFLIFMLPGLQALAQSWAATVGISNLKYSEITLKNLNLQYNLQLVPGQTFTGYISFWNNSEAPFTSSWAEDEKTNWLLDFEPKTLTLFPCEDPVTMQYFFKAPTNIGYYSITIVDTLGIYNPIDINLTVTEQPIPYDSVSFDIEVGASRTLKDPTNEWNGFYAGCNPLFFPADSQLHKFSIFPEDADWLSFDKDSILVPADQVEWLTWKMEPQKSGEQIAYIIKNREWEAYPAFVKVTLNPGQITSTKSYENEIANLGAGYPNPASDLFSIPFSLKKAGYCSFRIGNLQGKLLKTIDAGFLQPGSSTIHLDTSEFPPGIYYYQLISENYRPIGRRFTVID